MCDQVLYEFGRTDRNEFDSKKEKDETLELIRLTMFWSTVTASHIAR